MKIEDPSIAHLLLSNVLARFVKQPDGLYKFDSGFTEAEFNAFNFAIQYLTNPKGNSAQTLEQVQQHNTQAAELIEPEVNREVIKQKVETYSISAGGVSAKVESIPFVETQTHPDELFDDRNDFFISEDCLETTQINKSIFKLPDPATNMRVCLDFGTAMSKATLVTEYDDDDEEIEVLKLGVSADQEEISEELLISSVFIDDDARLWFGKDAVDMSLLQTGENIRQRVDNIKRYLSEDGLAESVSSMLNPTDISLSYEHIVVAYLSYFTWAMNVACEALGYQRNIHRRFALPCFDKAKHLSVSKKLKGILGKAQVLADTFSNQFRHGIDLYDFLIALEEIDNENFEYEFIKEDISEPLGVAGSLISWTGYINSLTMVIDIGAGTSDFSLYRLKYDQKTQKSAIFEVKNSSRGITEGGNYLDKILQALILSKWNLTASHPDYKKIVGAMNLKLREWKEALFNDHSVYIILDNENLRIDVEPFEITLDEFVNLTQVKNFSTSLRKCMMDILNNVDPSFIQGAPNRVLAVILTGGGCRLPMVQKLASGKIMTNVGDLTLMRAKEFPTWLENDYSQLGEIYPRIAVSLGGARKLAIQAKEASLTCEPVGSHRLERI